MKAMNKWNGFAWTGIGRLPLVTAILLLAAQASAGDWYVSVAGDDGYAGTSWDAAFATVQRALNEVIPENEGGLESLHVVVLDRAIGTWGEHDGRWHKRVNVLGQPALASVPGLYEAPAKPEAYYKEQQKHALLSGDAPPREVLENQVGGEFLIEDDPRTTDALKGYVLQAVDYLESGTPFCEQEGCRLFNAHYHEELIEAQLREPEFCDEHAQVYGAE